jgi:hypothetical protein
MSDLRLWPAIPGCYVAHLNSQLPERGVGYFNSEGGSLRYYSDGGKCFFEAVSGRFAFHVDGQSVVYVPGANL